MGLFKSLIRLHTESKLSDQYGLGAIELYSNTLNNRDKINAENNEKQEFEANKIKVINLLNKANNETEKYLNDYYINKIEAKIYIKSLEDYLKNHHITITNLYELNKKLEIDD